MWAPLLDVLIRFLWMRKGYLEVPFHSPVPLSTLPYEVKGKRRLPMKSVAWLMRPVPGCIFGPFSKLYRVTLLELLVVLGRWLQSRLKPRPALHRSTYRPVTDCWTFAIPLESRFLVISAFHRIHLSLVE